MKYQNLFLGGVGSHYPEPTPVDRAVADGRYDPAVRRRTGQVSVAIAGERDSQPDMAVEAGAAALRHSGLRAEQFALLLHAVAGYSGLDGWNAASYLQHRVLGGHGVSFEVHQLSNGAVGAMELAAAFLAAGPSREAALITASDRFAEPVWDRWTASPGLVFGDGASAAVLTRHPGFARVLSIATANDPELEGMQRGNLAFRPNPDPAHHPVNLKARTLEFAKLIGLDEITERMATGLRRAAETAATEAGIAITDADHVLTPNFGRELLHDECLDPLGVALERTTWRWGLRTGHVGASDQFGALDHLRREGALTAGQRVLLVGVGGGFNWTCAVLEILGEPAGAGR
ncbi:ketoacyl-ACP synthase III family protein [Kitasatospora sp. NPDC057541]|uniref:ketoacyl-ACP synthase III family protein n=1 Tax=unclassified Kitasatospora TaxID=2633591 RepID=UPI00367F6E6F